VVHDRAAADHVVVVDEDEQAGASPPVGLAHAGRGDLLAGDAGAQGLRGAADQLLEGFQGHRVAEAVLLGDGVDQAAAVVDDQDAGLGRV